MLMLLAALVAVLAIGGLLLARRPRRDSVAPPPPSAPVATAAAPAIPAPPLATPSPAAPGPAAPATPARARALPPALRAWRRSTLEQLPEAQRQALQQRLAQIPRPPLALQKLSSPEFLETVRPGELADLIQPEAQVAARLLATVNTPKYGLRKPVASVSQAVSLLGMNTVRGLCLQHLIDTSFQGGDAGRRARLAQIQDASARASALCARLAQALQWPEPGALVTQTVLGFLGPMAASTLLPTASPAWPLAGSLLQRRQAEQQALGLDAGELGGLLLQGWGLPASIVDAVRAIDTVLLTPCELQDARHAPRLALAYLCARIGEAQAAAAAAGAAPEAAQPDPDDTAHLPGYLALPALAGLPQALAGVLHDPARAAALLACCHGTATAAATATSATSATSATTASTGKASEPAALA